jgi:hypothetical protein
MQSVEIPLYQTGKLSVAAFQIGAAQDQQTKSAEPVHWNVRPEADSGRKCEVISEFSTNFIQSTV